MTFKILIVDDDPDVLFATSRVVASQGYQVQTASCGAECRDMAKKYRPDLILLDVMLPDASGPDLCREIKSEPSLRDTFVILISGMKISSDEQADGLDVGADGYIARPVSNRELRARVRAMARIWLAERERDRLIHELQDALSHIRQLSGLLPICSHCKNIRDEKGKWFQLETYIQKHSEAVFGDTICPDCARKHYPDLKLYDDRGWRNELY